MPTYSYECRKCGHIQDEFHSITANPRVKCVKCGGGCKRKLGSGAGIIFKGTGFYETDYKKSNSRGGGEKKSESKSESTSETKSESKSDSKSESNPKGDSGKKSAAKN
jgi:putative FmdB family regulatory protein